MPRKTEQLQIRVSPEQKAALEARADAAGMDVSRFVLEQALPSGQRKFRDLVAAMEEQAAAKKETTPRGPSGTA